MEGREGRTRGMRKKHPHRNRHVVVLQHRLVLFLVPLREDLDVPKLWDVLASVLVERNFALLHQLECCDGSDQFRATEELINRVLADGFGLRVRENLLERYRRGWDAGVATGAAVESRGSCRSGEKDEAGNAVVGVLRRGSDGLVDTGGSREGLVSRYGHFEGVWVRNEGEERRKRSGGGLSDKSVRQAEQS